MISSVTITLLLCVACSVNSLLGGSAETAGAATNGTIIYQEEVIVYIQAYHIVYVVINCLAERSSYTTLCHTSQRVHLCSSEFVT